MDVTSSSVLAERKRVRISEEYFESAPEEDATLTMRPVGLRAGRRVWQARSVL